MTHLKRATINLSGSAKGVLLLLATLLLIPAVVGTQTDHSERSSFEKRPLEPWPEYKLLSHPAEYFDRVDKFANDHIGLALYLNRVYRKMLFFVFHESPEKNITVGRDGFVFFNSHSAKHPYSDFRELCDGNAVKSNIRDRDKLLLNVAKYFQKRGLHVTYAAAPSKPGLYPDYFSESVPHELKIACSQYVAQEKIINEWSVLLSDYDVIFHYPYQEFYEHRLDNNFYPKENFHWNGYSTHLFAKTMFEAIGMDANTFSKVPVRSVSSKWDLQLIGFDRFVDVNEYDYSSFGTNKQYLYPKVVKKFYKRARDFSLYTTQHPLSTENILLISNSFGAYVAPHLAPGFRSVVHININHLQEEEYADFFGKMIDQLDVDRIVFLLHDTGYYRTWFFDWIMKSKQQIVKSDQVKLSR